MINRKLLAGAAMLGIAVSLAGCIAVGGSDQVTKPTLGRQLIDLKAVRDAGAIDEQQFQQARNNLLNSLRA